MSENLTPDAGQSQEFFDILWPEGYDEGDIAICKGIPPMPHGKIGPGGSGEITGTDMFYGLSLIKPDATQRREADCLATPGFVVDLDVDHPSRKRRDGFASMNAAEEFIKHRLKTPTAVVMTGHGYQLFYGFDKPEPSTRELSHELHSLHPL